MAAIALVAPMASAPPDVARRAETGRPDAKAFSGYIHQIRAGVSRRRP